MYSPCIPLYDISGDENVVTHWPKRRGLRAFLLGEPAIDTNDSALRAQPIITADNGVSYGMSDAIERK